MARLVLLTIPTGKREVVFDVLTDEEIDYVVSEETSGRDYQSIVYFPLPTNAVDDVLTRIREIGLGDEAITVTVDADAVISRQFERLEDRYEEEADRPEVIAREELQAAVDDLVPSFHIYIAMTVVSAIIATAGLLLNSAAVVGSMVIAPFIGPAMASNVGTIFGRSTLFKRGLKWQALGLGLSIASATVVAFLIRYANLIPPALTSSRCHRSASGYAPTFSRSLLHSALARRALSA